MVETHDYGRELFIQDGVLLKSALPKHAADVNASGPLILVEYPDNKRAVEWRPNYLIMVEADAQDQEWAVVDTVGRRSRTFSGGTSTGDSQANIRIVQTFLEDGDKFKISCGNRNLTLIKKTGLESCTFFFPNANADMFANHMKAYCKTVKSRADKNTYHIVQPNAEMENLNQSFAELDLFPENSADIAWYSVGNIVNNFKQKPFETALEALAKFSGYLSPDCENEVVDLLSRSVSNTDEHTHNSDEYEVVSKVPALPPRPSIPRGACLNLAQWDGLKDCNGKIYETDGVKQIIFRGGVHPSLRYVVWKYLLNYYPWDMSHIELAIHKKLKVQEYYTMKQQWKSMTLAQENRFNDYKEKKSLIGKDVNRTDRTIPYYAGDNNPNLDTLSDILITFVMYNFDLGYVQGMSDLLAPILCLMDNEVDAFWCFVGFMEKVQNNFDIDQAGMKFQLENLHQLLLFTNPDLGNYLNQHDSGNMYFCFRWLLVLFKREFSQCDIMRLWEVLWTGVPCPNFHLLICVAILDTEKDTLMSRSYGFTEILKHVNDLSMQLELEHILSKAEGIYHQVIASSHLTDPIRIILGIEPLNLMPTNMTNSAESQDENAPITSANFTPSASDLPNETSGSGISLQTDRDEVLYQRSIDMNFL